MFYDEIKTKQKLSYIVCSLRIPYNSKFILMAASLGTNAVVVTRVSQYMREEAKPHCYHKNVIPEGLSAPAF